MQSRLSNASPTGSGSDSQLFGMQSRLSNASPVLNQSLFKILFPSAISRQPSAVSHQPSAVSHQPSAVSRQLYHALWVPAKPIPVRILPSAISYQLPANTIPVQNSFPVSYQLSAISCQLTQFLFKILFPSAVSLQPSAVSRQQSAFSLQPSAVSFIMPFGYQPSRSLRSWPPLRYPHHSYPICQKPAKFHHFCLKTCTFRQVDRG